MLRIFPSLYTYVFLLVIFTHHSLMGDTMGVPLML